LGNTYQQAVLAIVDPATFASVRQAVSTAFSTPRVADFLKSVERSSLRIRDFESVLAKGLLGALTAEQYAGLGGGDQGQLRELYLASLEQVAPGLRNRFFKLYAYY